MNAPARILFLYRQTNSQRKMRAAVCDHLHILDLLPKNYEVLYYNCALPIPRWLRRYQFHAVILHPTVLCLRWRPNFIQWKRRLEWLGEWNCLKIAIPQDEYDHSAVLDEWLDEWNISVIFSCFGGEQRRILYPRTHGKASFYHCLTGYINDRTALEYSRRITPLKERRYDIVYRAAHLPYWFGSHGQLKHQIGRAVQEAAKKHGLDCNISTEAKDTIVGNEWFNFLGSGRCVIGCESGSSVLDPRGAVQAKIMNLMKKNPEMSFVEVSSHLPSGWDSHRFFAISPRHLEAVITKTCQILVTGEYQGILEPGRHYIPIKPDFSDLDAVLEKVRDQAYLQRIIDQAYNDIYLSRNYSYLRFAATLDEAIRNFYCNHSAPGPICEKWVWGLGQGAASVSNIVVTIASQLRSIIRSVI